MAASRAPHELLQSCSITDWNEWRRSHPGPLDLTDVTLTGRDISGMDLSAVRLIGSDLTECSGTGASFARADLTDADVSGSELIRCDFSEACLRRLLAVDCNLRESWFFGTDLAGATLARSRFLGCHFSRASLRRCDLTECDLARCLLIGVDVTDARLVSCSVYGMSAWNLVGQPAESLDLRITSAALNAITVDDLRIAQFMHLLIDNESWGAVIDEVTTKVVLVLGRFTAERKTLLNGLREVLRARNRVPVLFDFDRPANRSFRETVMLLAHLSRVVVADLSDALEVRSELSHIAMGAPSTPIVPIIARSQVPYVTFEDLRSFPWVREPVVYTDSRSLEALADAILAAAP